MTKTRQGVKKEEDDPIGLEDHFSADSPLPSGKRPSEMDTPTAKRARFWNSMESDTPIPRKFSITSADDLDELDLKEIYKIMDGRVKALSHGLKTSSEDMEKFVQEVFRDWNGDKRVSQPTTWDMDSFLRRIWPMDMEDSHSRNKAPVGSAVLGTSENFNLHYCIQYQYFHDSFSVDLCDAEGSPQATTALKHIKWKPAKEVEQILQMLWDDACQKLARGLDDFNHRNAITYARSFLLSRASGTTVSHADSGYAFKDLDGLVRGNPLLLPAYIRLERSTGLANIVAKTFER